MTNSFGLLSVFVACVGLQSCRNRRSSLPPQASPSLWRVSVAGKEPGLKRWPPSLYIRTGMLFRKTNADRCCVYQQKTFIGPIRWLEPVSKRPQCLGCAHTRMMGMLAVLLPPPYFSSSFSSFGLPKGGMWTLLFTLRAGTGLCLSLTGWATAGLWRSNLQNFLSLPAFCLSSLSNQPPTLLSNVSTVTLSCTISVLFWIFSACLYNQIIILVRHRGHKSLFILFFLISVMSLIENPWDLLLIIYWAR